MVSGEVEHISKAYPGAFSELAIVRRELLPHRVEGERFLADNIFRDERFYVTARKGSEARKKRIRQYRWRTLR